MNFLAHAFLAADDPALVVGGVIGDWIKGPLPGPLPADLARGVALHRAIDSHAEQEYLDDPVGYGADFAHWLDDARDFVSQWSRRL